MLGSHNTFSYLSSNNILKKWGKCQEVNFVKQYECGARCFDIRVRFDKNDRIQIIHNNILYKKGESELNKFLDFAADKDIYIRLLLDIRSKPKDADRQVELFKELIDSIQNKLALNVIEAIVFWDWSFIISKMPVYEKHASVTNNIGIFKTPKKYAEKNNSSIREEYKDIIDSNNKVLLIDFVNL